MEDALYARCPFRLLGYRVSVTRSSRAYLSHTFTNQRVHLFLLLDDATVLERWLTETDVQVSLNF